MFKPGVVGVIGHMHLLRVSFGSSRVRECKQCEAAYYGKNEQLTQRFLIGDHEPCVNAIPLFASLRHANVSLFLQCQDCLEMTIR
jgi:hypothetical protein